jgi:hypothetical protein
MARRDLPVTEYWLHNNSRENSLLSERIKEPFFFFSVEFSTVGKELLFPSTPG